MKIISPFKDYYDYLSYQYGIDNNICYFRKPRISKEDLNLSEEKFDRLCSCICRYIGLISSIVIKNIQYDFYSLSILGKIIIYVNEINKNSSYFRIANKNDFENYKKISDKGNTKDNYIKDYSFDKIKYVYFEERKKFDNYFKFWIDNEIFRTGKKYIGDRIGCVDIFKDDLMLIHKNCKQPIINGITYNLTLSTYLISIPNLSKIQGISGVINSFELYKNLTNFFINIKDSVDTKPPVEISNKDKIVKAGFDTKSSFRNPIK